MLDEREAPKDMRDEVLARMTGRLVSRDLDSSRRIFSISRELFDLSRLPHEELTGVLRMMYKQDTDLSVVILLNGDDQAVVEPVFLSEEQILDHLDEYEFVSWRGTELPVVGWMQSVVLGDGRPAVVEVERGKGKAFLFNFLPGLGYLKTDAPVKVVRYRRGTTGGRRTPLSWTWRRLRRCGRPWEA